jgi:hypothetical protein
MRAVVAFVIIGGFLAFLTVLYALGDDFLSISALQSPAWGERANRLALAQLLLNVEAIVVAGGSVLYIWLTDRHRDQDFCVYFLQALREELKFNLTNVQMLPTVGDFSEAPSDFWDPSLQEFRMRDDACTYAVIEGQARLRLPAALFTVLLEVSAAIRFTNQQIEEVMAFRRDCSLGTCCSTAICEHSRMNSPFGIGRSAPWATRVCAHGCGTRSCWWNASCKSFPGTPSEHPQPAEVGLAGCLLVVR